MKKSLFLFLLVPLSVFAMETDCDDENNLAKLAKGITYPNCYVPANIQDLTIRKTETLCNACKSEFEIVHGTKIIENKANLQEDFFKSAFNEYKKNITNNLLNALKSKSLPATGSSLSMSIAACKMKEPSDFLNKCKSSAAKKLLANPSFFENLSQELGNDVAKFLSKEEGYDPKPTVLVRTQKECHIPESDVMLYASSTFEEALSPEIIEYFKKVDPTKHQSIFEVLNSDDFVETFGDPSDLKVSLGNHPLISAHLRTTESFVNFMKKVSSPSKTSNLRDLLYDKKNGDEFDKSLAESCNKSFEALQTSICSDQFENGQIFIDPSENFRKLGISKQLPTEESLASTEKAIDLNIKLLELCENKLSENKLNLTKFNNDIGYSLQEEQRPMSLDLYKASKYNSEIGSLTTSLCEMTEKTCIGGTLTCSIFKKYKALSDQPKPSSFANTAVNELIRGMIGNTSKIDPQTKQILIYEGIIPKEDGQLVQQQPNPETPQQFLGKLPSDNLNRTPVKQNTVSQPSTQPARFQPSSNNYSNNSTSTQNTDSVAPDGKMDDISDLVRGSTEDIRDIQNEIKRRLGALPQNKPATIEEAKRIARDTFKSKGRKITPYQEQALADRMLRSEVPNSVSSSAAAGASSGRAEVSNTETQAQKWQNGRRDEALMGMAGAQQVMASGNGRTPANVEPAPKEMTKVALNIAEDPKVKLSDLFSNKIDLNDPETQLLKVLFKNKSNFLLQIKGMNFKVVFNQNNHFNVLLESGDRVEADRMRPQLEIFLKRLKS